MEEIKEARRATDETMGLIEHAIAIRDLREAYRIPIRERLQKCRAALYRIHTDMADNGPTGGEEAEEVAEEGAVEVGDAQPVCRQRDPVLSESGGLSVFFYFNSFSILKTTIINTIVAIVTTSSNHMTTRTCARL